MKKPTLFLIHGLYMHGAVMSYMRLQLEKRGYDVKVFSYNSVKNTMEDNARALIEFVKENSRENSQSGEVRHFVGHSLGGLLIRLAYEASPEWFTGKIVTIGTPHNGSLVAYRIANDIHSAILGGAFLNALDGNLPEWRGEIPLGSIAGTKCIGVGMALKSLPRPNDGTVSAEEAYLENQSDYLEVPLSHTILIYSDRVVAQVDTFLRAGRFHHDDSPQA